jgi:hypothetical protein
MNGHRISTTIEPFVDAALNDHALGEDVLWEGSIQPAPDGTAVFVLCFWLPDVVLGRLLQGSFAIQNPTKIEADEITDVVHDFLRQMHEARSQNLAKETAEVVPPTPLHRGQQTPSGLVIG